MIAFKKESGANNLIIFIHGLTGNDKTWNNLNNKPFKDLLLENKEIEKSFDIAYFSYESTLIEAKIVSNTKNLIKSILGSKRKTVTKNLDIDSISDILASEIRFKCDKYQNIIFIAHSMGGLITKSYILKAIDKGESKVGMFISLAVPHDGSNLAVLAKLLLKENCQIKNLEPLNPQIKNLNSKWIKSTSIPKTVYFIGEYDEVVPKSSSVAYESVSEDSVSCEADHFSISKPESSDALVIKAVTKLLLEKKYIEKKYIDKDIYNNELFVLKLLMENVQDISIDIAKETFFNAEFLIRTLLPNELEQLREIDTKLKILYVEEYDNLVSGKINNSNELVTAVHKIIRKEDEILLKSLCKKINVLHKTGRIHQLSNLESEKIWWGVNKRMEKVLEFKEE